MEIGVFFAVVATLGISSYLWGLRKGALRKTKRVRAIREGLRSTQKRSHDSRGCAVTSSGTLPWIEADVLAHSFLDGLLCAGLVPADRQDLVLGVLMDRLEDANGGQDFSVVLPERRANPGGG